MVDKPVVDKPVTDTPVSEKSRAKRVEQLVEHLELAIEEVMEVYQDCGITIETDFRGYTTTLTVRIHKNKAGGILKRNIYQRKKGSA
jgi:hypothetical protein